MLHLVLHLMLHLHMQPPSEGKASTNARKRSLFDHVFRVNMRSIRQ